MDLINPLRPAWVLRTHVNITSSNVFKLDITGVLENKEFNDLIKILGCNIGAKFDLSKLQYNKIIVASDADVDGLFIRSLMLSFFFKCFPEMITDGRIYISEPPLYRINNKADPFVINKEDYVTRYAASVVKDYKVGYSEEDYMNRNSLLAFLTDTSNYVDDIFQLSQHYKLNDRLVEMIIEELAYYGLDGINVNKFINRVNQEFPEIYYDEKDRVIKGVIDGKYQLFEIGDRFIRKTQPLVDIIKTYGADRGESLILKNTKSSTELELSLLGVLKVLKKYQPDIVHRFKGLGENSSEDLHITVMNPNTRTLIKVSTADIENDMKVFQMLRGATLEDRNARKEMMSTFPFDTSLIDT